MPSENRRLAAILFADIVGYTALMESNEQLALHSLKKFKTTLDFQIPNHNGTIIQYYGDGCLATFNSAVDATACAKSLQETLRMGDSKVPVRIGLHVGDIVEREGNVFGDAVNVTSRIESMGVPGSVLLSQSVRNQIKNQESFQLKSIGDYEFKNVKEGIMIYALANPGFPIPDLSQVKGKFRRASQNQNWKLVSSVAILVVMLGVVYWLVNVFIGQEGSLNVTTQNTEKSIAVLPFRNDSSDPEETQHYCNGVMEGIRNNLSKMNALQVVSRRSVEQYRNSPKLLRDIAVELDVNYILDGSIRKQNDQIKINTELIDGDTEKQIWSESYVLDIEDIFQMESNVSRQIADELKVQITPEEEVLIAAVPTKNIKAFEELFLGKELHSKFQINKDPKFFESALNRYNKALELDPGFPQAYAAIAQLYWDRDFQAGYMNENWLDTLPVLCDKAIELDPNLDTPYYLKGIYYKEKNEIEKSKRLLKKALEITPNFAEASLSLGLLFSESGQYVKALEWLYKTAELDRSDYLSVIYNFIGSIYYTIGAFDDARVYLEKQLELNPNEHGAMFWFEALQGNFEAAYELAQEEYALKPQAIYSVEIMALSNMYLKNFAEAESYFDRWIKKLNEAGAEHATNRLRNRYGFVLWQNEKKEAAMKEFETNEAFLKKALELNRSMGTIGPGLYDLAATAAFLNKKEEAFKWLNEFAQHGWNWGSAYFIDVDPLFDNIREEATFKAIVKKAQVEKKAVRDEIKLLN